MEKQLQELSARLATPLTTTGDSENVSTGILTALRLFGLTSRPHPTGENLQSESVNLAGAFSAFIAALDRLTQTSAGPAPPDLELRPKSTLT